MLRSPKMIFAPPGNFLSISGISWFNRSHLGLFASINTVHSQSLIEDEIRAIAIPTHYSTTRSFTLSIRLERHSPFDKTNPNTITADEHRTPSQCHDPTTLDAVMSLLVSTDFRMTKVLHPNPSHHNPNPCHNCCQYDQGRVVSHDRQRRVIFKLWRCIGCLANIPGPTPYS